MSHLLQTAILFNTAIVGIILLTLYTANRKVEQSEAIHTLQGDFARTITRVLECQEHFNTTTQRRLHQSESTLDKLQRQTQDIITRVNQLIAVVGRLEKANQPRTFNEPRAINGEPIRQILARAKLANRPPNNSPVTSSTEGSTKDSNTQTITLQPSQSETNQRPSKRQRTSTATNPAANTEAKRRSKTSTDPDNSTL